MKREVERSIMAVVGLATELLSTCDTTSTYGEERLDSGLDALRKLRAAEAALDKGLLKDVPGDMLSKLNECIGKVDREASARLVRVCAEEDADLMLHWAESAKASQDAKIPEFTNQASISAIKPFMSETMIQVATPYLALVGTAVEVMKSGPAGSQVELAAARGRGRAG
jgi:hypothetical protein